VIMVYVLAAWCVAGLLLAWPVGALLGARLNPPRSATDEPLSFGVERVVQDPAWAEVEVSLS
jgi:hypothetical protein